MFKWISNSNDIYIICYISYMWFELHIKKKKLKLQIAPFNFA